MKKTLIIAVVLLFIFSFSGMARAYAIPYYGKDGLRQAEGRTELNSTSRPCRFLRFKPRSSVGSPEAQTSFSKSTARNIRVKTAEAVISACSDLSVAGIVETTIKYYTYL